MKSKQGFKDEPKEKVAYDKGYRCTRDGRLLNPLGKEIGSTDNKGYIRFSIPIDNVRVNVTAHRLQAYQKYGRKIYSDNLQVRHLNECKTDFSWENIALGTQSQNMMDRSVEERKKCANIASSRTQKYDHKEVKQFYQTCKSWKQTMKHFGISSTGTLHYILNAE